MTAAPVQTAGAQVWICDDCGRQFAWTERSYWYGSLKDVEAGNWHRINSYCGCRPCPGPMEREVA